MRIRKIADCQRVLCAAPDYIARRGMPTTGAELIADKHECLNLRYPGATEFQWMLETPDGPKRFAVSGRFECDDGDVLTDWALSGQGIAMKPVFRSGRSSQGRAPGGRSDADAARVRSRWPAFTPIGGIRTPRRACSWIS